MGKLSLVDRLVRLAVVCLVAFVPAVSKASAVAQLPFFDGFESGTFGDYWSVDGTANYLTEITSGYGPATGGNHLVMACTVDRTYSRNEVTLTVDLSNYGNVVLTYDAIEYGDEPDGPPSYPFVGHANFDGVAVSEDGTNWYEVASLRGLSSIYTSKTVDLDALVAAAGISYNSTFRIRFNQYDNYALDTDGIGIDNVAINGDLLDDLFVNPTAAQSFFGYKNGPFSPSNLLFSVSNVGSNSLSWTVDSAPWLICSSAGGVLAAGSNDTVQVSLDPNVAGWETGISEESILFKNEASGFEQQVPVSLIIKERVMDHFEWASVGTNQVVGIPFPVVITAKDGGGQTFSAYAEAVSLSAVYSNQFFAIAPSNSENFVDGVWTGTVTVLEAATNISLRADDGADHLGDSNPFNAQPFMLSVILPESVVEGGVELSARVTANHPPESDLYVSLSADLANDIVIPASIILSAGQTNVSFDIQAADDQLLDGTVDVTVTASTTNHYLAGSSAFRVHDNETATLSLSLPETTYEGIGRLEGSLLVNAAPENDIMVELRSSDTNEISFSSVVIPAGQTVAPVEFTVIDDEVMDGVKTVMIEAHVHNWTDDTCHVFVFDNEQGPIVPAVPEVPEEVPEAFKLVEVGQLTGLTGVTKIEYCPERDLLFLMSGNDVRIVQGSNGAVLGTRDATQTFTDMDLTRDGRYLFVADYGGERTGYGTPINPHYVHRYDLDNSEWMAAQAPKIAWKIEAVSSDRVLLQEHDQHVDMTLNSFGNAMVELSRVRADYYGDLEYDPVTKRAYHGSSGSSSSEIHVRTISGDTLVSSGDTGVYGTAQSGGGTSVLSTDGKYFFYGRLQVDAMNIRSNIRSLPESIYAASSRIALGKVNYYSAHTGEGLGTWGFTCGALGVSEDGKHVWAYEAASSTLHHYIDAVLPYVALPVEAKEADGLLSMSGSVEVAAAPSSNLVINLSSSDPNEVGVPASVIMLAGETNASFDIVILDDALFDGTQSVKIYAVPNQQGYADSEGVIVVHDNESALLSLTLPQSTVEGAGYISGMVNMSTVADRDVVVTLVSDNPEKISHGRTVIKAGDGSAAFTLPVNDNGLIDSLQTATIEARVENWIHASAAVFIADNETTEIRLELPEFTMEGDGISTNAGEVIISGTLASDVHIMLKSLDSGEVTVPLYVTIPAGQTNVFFDIAAVDDDIVDGKQYPIITATAPGFVTASYSMSVSDNEFHHFTMVGFNGEDPGYLPVPCSVHAVNIDGEYVDTYSGSAWLSGMLGSNSVAVDPSDAITLTNGVWQGDVTFHGVGDDALIVMDDGQGHIGTNQVTLGKFNIVKMTTDWELPYVYMVHKYETAPNRSVLIWYNTDTESIEHALGAGENVTDLTVSYADNRIYVSNWKRSDTQVFDRGAKMRLEPLALGNDVYHINAAGPGRVITEEEDQWIYVRMRDAQTGETLVQSHEREGDGECTLDGRYYYRCDNNISNARLYKYAITNNAFTIANSTRTKSYYGSRNVLVSMDGSRVFNCGVVYDGDLRELHQLGSEIYAASAYGDLVMTATKAYNGATGQEVYALPFSTSVMAFSGNQSNLVLYAPSSGSITSIATSVIMPIPTVDMVPDPADNSVQGVNLPEMNWTGAPAAVGYDVYLGTTSNAVATASTNDVEYLGRVIDPTMPLPSGTLSGDESYFWRVDTVGFRSQIVTGDVWNFFTPAIYLNPHDLEIDGVAATYTQKVSVVIGSSGGTPSWTASTTNDWITLGSSSGTAPAVLDIEVDISKLSVGGHTGTIEFNSGGTRLTLPVDVALENMRIVKMTTDWARPYIYMAHTSGVSPYKSLLIWYNTDTEMIEHVIDAGENITDLTVHYGDDRLYASNWKRPETRVFDLSNKVQLEPLALGGDVYKINAAGPGQVITEGEDQWITVSMRDSVSSALVSSRGEREGDGDCSLDGRYYFHTDNNSSGARLSRFDVSNDGFAGEISVKTKYYYGSRNVFVSGDGQRVFNCGTAYRAADLKEIANFGVEAYAASFYGQYVVTGTDLREVDSNEVVLSLPTSGAISAFSRSQEKLVLYDAAAGTLIAQDLNSVPGLESSGLQVPGLAPGIDDGANIAFSQDWLEWAREPFATRYEVYLGTDSNAVTTATTNSALFMGAVEDAHIELADSGLVPGTTYYWRVDAIGAGGLLDSKVWSFTVTSLGFHPSEVNMVLFNIDGLTNSTLTVDTMGSSEAWTITSVPSWLSISSMNGIGDGSIVLSVDKSMLVPGGNEGIITVSSGGNEFALPVEVLRLNEVVKCFEPGADGKLYAASYEAGHDQSYLFEIDGDPLVAQRVLELPENITDLDIDPAGTNLFSISFLDGTISRIDINEFKVLDSRIAPVITKSSSSNHFHVEAGTNGIVYYMDAAWAPAIHVFDYKSGVNLSSHNNGGEGLGGLVYDEKLNRIYSWRQFGWGAGNINSWVYTFDCTSNRLAKVQASSSQHRDPRDTPLLLVNDRKSFFNKKRRFKADDLSVIEATFAQNIYAATSGGTLAVGGTQVYRGIDGTLLATLPYSTGLRTVLSDDERMVHYNSTTKTIETTRFVDLFDPLLQVSNQVPENGKTVMYSLDTFEWDLQDGARQFEVYLGTDSNAVANAGVGDVQYLGATYDAWFAIPTNTLGRHQTYYWRVDAVGYDNATVSGAVLGFKVSDMSILPEVLNLQALDADYAFNTEIDIETPGAWSVTAAAPWVSLTPTVGSGSETISVTVDAALLDAGNYNTDITFQDSGGFEVELPVQIDVFALNITKMETDVNNGKLYALNVVQEGLKPSQLVILDVNGEQIEQVVSVVDNALDFAVHYGDDRIYASAFGKANVSVIDRADFQRLEDLTLNTHVYRISAGIAGRLVTEDDGSGNAYYGRMRVWDSQTGSLLQTTSSYYTGRGTGESDATGSFYYRGDSTRYPYAGYLRKYDLTGGIMSYVKGVSASKSARRELVLSGDGSRVFWTGGLVYDADLNVITNLGAEIYAASSDGSMAATASVIYDADTGSSVATLPVASSAMAFAENDTRLAYFNSISGTVEWLALSPSGPPLVPTGGIHAEKAKSGAFSDWTSSYFPHLSAAPDAMVDSDLDGQLNIEEFVAGTDPTRGDSYFAVHDIQALESGDVVISWESVSNRVYSIEFTPALDEPFQILAKQLAYPVDAYTDRVDRAESGVFYRVGVELQD